MSSIKHDIVHFLYEEYHRTWDSPERGILVNLLEDIVEVAILNYSYWPTTSWWQKLDIELKTNLKLKEALEQRLLLYKLSL